MATSVTIKTCYASVTVEVDNDDMPFDAFFSLVVEPALRCHYSQETINNYLGEE